MKEPAQYLADAIQRAAPIYLPGPCIFLEDPVIPESVAIDAIQTALADAEKYRVLLAQAVRNAYIPSPIPPSAP